MIKPFRLSSSKSIIQQIFIYLKQSELISKNTCCIFPTGRNKRSLVNKLKLFETSPAIYSISEFDNLLFKIEKPIVPKELRHFFMRHAAERLSKNDKLTLFKNTEPEFLSNFITFAETGNAFFRFFREMKQELITPEELAKNSLYTDYEQQTKIMYALWSRYSEVLSENNFSDIIDIVDNPQFNSFFYNKFSDFVFLTTGFLTKHEMNTLKKLSDKANVHIFFHFSGEKSNNHKSIERELGIEIPDEEHYEPQNFIDVIETGSMLEEYEFIVDKIYQTETKGVDLSKMVVILSDDRMKNYFIDNDVYNLFNVTTGTEGSSSQIIQTIEIILKAAEEYFKSKEYIKIETAEKIASQPFLQKLSGFSSFKEYVAEMVKGNRLILKTHELFKNKNIKKTLEPFLNTQPQTLEKTASNLIKLSKVFLEHTEDEREKQHNSIIIKELKRLKIIYKTISDTFPQHTALEQVLSNLSQIGFHRPGGKVTVMGLLETRNLNPEVVFIPNMNADIFPPSNNKELFLNTELRKSLGLPTFQDREQLIKNYMSQVIAKAKFVYFSYISSDKGASYRSPFLEEIIIKRKLTSRIFSTQGHKIFDTTKNGLKTYNNSHFKEDPLIAEKLKKRGISATMLNDFLVCPYKFYAKYIFKLKSTERPENFIASYKYGNIIHQALEELYEKDAPKDAKTISLKLAESFQKSVETFDAFWLNPLEKEQAADMIRKFNIFAKSEEERFENGWEVVTQEDVLDVKFGDMPIKGRLDRIDKNEKLSAIIDYKFKTIKEFKKFEPEKIKDVQMPLYALLFYKKYKKKPDEVFWYDMKKEFKPVTAFDSELLEDFELYLNELIQIISDPEKIYNRTEKQSDCTYCDFADLCGRN